MLNINEGGYVYEVDLKQLEVPWNQYAQCNIEHKDVVKKK